MRDRGEQEQSESKTSRNFHPAQYMHVPVGGEPRLRPTDLSEGAGR